MKWHVETKEPNTFRFPVESIEITQTEGEKGALKHLTQQKYTKAKQANQKANKTILSVPTFR